MLPLAAVWVIQGRPVKFKIRCIFPSPWARYTHPSLSHWDTSCFYRCWWKIHNQHDPWWLTDIGLHSDEAYIALCPLPAVGKLSNCGSCSSDLSRWRQECVLTRAKLCGNSMQGEPPIRAQFNEPVDPVQLSDVTWYPSRLNLASATLTPKQESTLRFAPDLAANLQVQVAQVFSLFIQWLLLW